MIDLGILLSIFGVFTLVVSAWLYSRSKSAQINTSETAKLAETRGARIEDLESELHRLTGRVASLEGQIQALQGLKAQEIALEVSRMLHQEFVVKQKNEGQT